MSWQSNFFKQKFASFLAGFDEESYKTHSEKKEVLFEEVTGNVLEIGPGTGVNFPFLDSTKISWCGIEPNLSMHPYLFRAGEKHCIEVTLVDCTTEAICIPDESVDYVISTEVLCSVGNLESSLSEIRRVLRPEGKFLFLEHVLDKQKYWRRIVQRTVPLTPWRYFSGGCRPCRDIGRSIKDAGFNEVTYTEYLQEGYGIIASINRPHIFGWARK